MNNTTISCSINICQNNGKCFLTINHTTTTTTPYCLCNRCFIGDQCEIEKYSKNLWGYGISEENKSNFNEDSAPIILGILSIISFMSNLLSLQTFLSSKKIRITNLGIYLILFSVGGLTLSLTEGTYAFITVVSIFTELRATDRLIWCAFVEILPFLLVDCICWLGLYIAAERVLIEYSFVSLYDSRQRSVISSVLLFSLIILTDLLPILFGQKDYIYNSYDFCAFDFTSTGYIFYSIFYYIGYTAAPLAFSIAPVVIFKHLIKHRRDLIDNESFRSSLILIASKHYDFFLPIILYCLMTSPEFILEIFMDCSRADSETIFRLQFVAHRLGHGALALTFFIYVYLSKVYLAEFWKTSPFGRFLIYVKKRFIKYFKHQMVCIR